MLFPTIDFAIFICVVFAASWLLAPRGGRSSLPWKVFATVASYVFYGWWDPSLVWLLALVTVLAQVAALAIERGAGATRSRLLIGGCVAIVLAPLLWFKYYAWIAEATADAFSLVGVASPLPLKEIILPIGISFYTFMAISYVVDVWREEIKPAGWLDLSLYLSFFPHLVAGPIVRPRELLPQFDTERDPASVDIGQAARLIFRGLFKKVVVSSFLAANLVDPVFSDPHPYGTIDVLLAIYGYAIVIYADFSGYTDIAIGVAELLGFRFPVNFDAPYTATSLRDFWRRWHMTLSRWLRDYLYIPLGGSRGSPGATYRNIMITMLLGGLWHGAGWTFLVWGAIHGVGQVIGHARSRREPSASERTWLKRLATFHVVCLAWVFFRAETLAGAAGVLGRLVAGAEQPPVLASPAAVLVIAGMLAAQYLRRVPRVAEFSAALWDRFAGLDPVSRGAAAAVILFAITTMGPEGVAPFIYFRF